LLYFSLSRSLLPVSLVVLRPALHPLLPARFYGNRIGEVTTKRNEGRMDSVLGVLVASLLAFLLVVSAAAARKGTWDGKIVMPKAEEEEASERAGVRWAVLLAGSAGYGNYRHQVLAAP
jgi:hypothetical protein